MNTDSPSAFLPATVCHEMAHQRGITAEEECNFIGILAAIRSDSAAYRYSGWLTGFGYLSNALYSADRRVADHSGQPAGDGGSRPAGGQRLGHSSGARCPSCRTRYTTAS